MESSASLLHHQGVLGDGAVEVVGGGIDHVLAPDALERLQRLVEDLAVGQRLGVGQAEVGAEEGGQLVVLDEVGHAGRRRRLGIAGVLEQLSGGRVAQGERARHLVQQRTIRRPQGVERLLGCRVRLADALEPGQGLGADCVRGGRPELAEGGQVLQRFLLIRLRHPAARQDERQAGDRKPASPPHGSSPVIKVKGIRPNGPCSHNASDDARGSR